MTSKPESPPPPYPRRPKVEQEGELHCSPIAAALPQARARRNHPFWSGFWSCEEVPRFGRLPEMVPNTCRVRVLQHRVEPDELTAKHLSMLGAAVLILVHSVRERYASSNTVAGKDTPLPAPPLDVPTAKHPVPWAPHPLPEDGGSI